MFPAHVGAVHVMLVQGSVYNVEVTQRALGVRDANLCIMETRGQGIVNVST